MPATAPGHPASDEYAPFYATYVDLVAPDEDLFAALDAQREEVGARIASVPADRWEFAYAPGKWTVAEVFLHVCDAEWLFMGRAFWFGRGDPGPLPGLDQDAFMAGAAGAARDPATLTACFGGLRQGAAAFLRGLPAAAFTRRGNASGTDVSVRALACIALGHVRHHLRVLEERYGV